ncbi:hypothetical protein WIS52_29150 [Pseudonocardia nematodicida]|uniref:Glycerophosphoryl diester phosphodiesterase membrane domain-containing protein n=1 Tax=Pseudonocardia nematodicida TaxID=1206997 RepID=A0ABV1KJC1_9PSEU
MSTNEPGWGTPPEPQQGIVPARPLGAGEIVSGGVRFVRANPGVVLPLGLAAALAFVLPQVLVVLGRGFPPPATAPADPLAGTLPETLLAMVVALAVLPPVTATVLGTLLPVVQGRRGIRLAEAWAVARPRFGALYVVQIVVSMIGFVPLLIFSAIAPLWLSGGVRVFVALLVTLAVYAAMVYVSVLLALAPAAAAVEGLPWRDALWRSVELVRGSWWRCLGVQILVALSVAAASLVVVVPAVLLGIGAAVAGSAGAAIAVAAVAGLLLLAVLAAAYGFSIGAVGLLHHDQRLRRGATPGF